MSLSRDQASDKGSALSSLGEAWGEEAAEPFEAPADVDVELAVEAVFELEDAAASCV